MNKGGLIGLHSANPQGHRQAFSGMQETYDAVHRCRWELAQPNDCLNIGAGTFHQSDPRFSFAQIGPVHLWCLGLLRNPEHIRGLLPSAQSHRFETAAELLAATFAQIGDALFAHLRGELTLLIWDERQQELFLVRDKFGFLPIYYVQKSGRVAFADRPDVFTSVGIAPQIDLRSVARLTLANAERIHHRAQFFKNVKAVSPAHYLKVSPSGTEMREYWAPAVQNDVARLSVPAANAALSDILKDTVASYYKSGLKIGTLASGGLDSTALGALALREDPALLAMTTVDYTSASAEGDDDAAFLRHAVDTLGLQAKVIRPPADVGPFTDIDAEIHHNHTPLIMNTSYQMAAFGAAADEAGVDLVFDGALGEYGTSYKSPRLILDAFLQGDVGWAARSLWQRKQIFGTSFPRQVWRDVVRPMQGAAPITTTSWASYLQPDFVVDQKPSPGKLRGDSLQGTHQERMLRRLNGHRRAAGVLGALGRGNAAHRVFPFMDPEVVQFAVSVDPKAHMQNGYQRGLIRGAMAPLWSARQRNRVTKSPFVPDWSSRFERQRADALARVTDISPNSAVWDILNRNEITKQLAQENLSAMQSRSLTNAVYMIFFLDRFGI